METKHTPEPWKVYGRDGKSKCYVTDADGRTIADLDSFCTGADSAEQTEANAKLIAAAPDLLAACKLLARQDRGGKIPWVHSAGVTKDIEKLRAICLAYADVWNNHIAPAIAKATA